MILQYAQVSKINNSEYTKANNDSPPLEWLENVVFTLIELGLHIFYVLMGSTLGILELFVLGFEFILFCLILGSWLTPI